MLVVVIHLKILFLFEYAVFLVCQERGINIAYKDHKMIYGGS